MDDEKLIELVRQHEALYDLSSPRYMDNRYKLNIWAQIAREMDLDVILCKTRWYNIRDNYRKSLRKAATKSGLSTKKMKLYKYSEQLQFLHEFLEDKKPTCKLGADQKTGEDQDYSTEDYKESGNEDAFSPNVSNETSNDNTTYLNNTSSKSQIQRKTIKRIVPRRPTTSSLRKYIINKNETQSMKSERDPIDAFLAGIAPTLKTLNPFYLNLAKSEIFTIVQKYEMKMLMQQDPLIEDRSVMDLSRSMSAHYNIHSRSPSPTINQSPSECSDVKEAI